MACIFMKHEYMGIEGLLNSHEPPMRSNLVKKTDRQTDRQTDSQKEKEERKQRKKERQKDVGCMGHEDCMKERDRQAEEKRKKRKKKEKSSFFFLGVYIINCTPLLCILQEEVG